MDTAAAVKILRDAIDVLETPAHPDLSLGQRLGRARAVYDVIRLPAQADYQTLTGFLRDQVEQEIQAIGAPFPYTAAAASLEVTRGTMQAMRHPERLAPRPGRRGRTPKTGQPPQS